ncbi:hypothetical protein JAAARDRAFT_54572 [Jaapia argillacea MUCL 33604]|uniref:RecF/RecN/SMC N-terminal domain-containing protein n=1 Tax=Jaapia argillacea MUCL 33604 TaxID=933084 RepID=A0A067QJ63_9AGAM|nr:hypothetical protein JAAARDRAFT_54572 [Jaapia argillacea MUCL 33604]
MAKRPVAPESDAEPDSVPNTPASKRARTQDPSAEPSQRGSKRSQPKGKGKVRKQDEDDIDLAGSDDAEVPEVKDEEDEEEVRKFEEEQEEAIRASLEAKSKTVGGVAEMGIIESIQMFEFMCHKYLTFTFGPQVNFIIGGKSAVLSAITVALGGKANSTGRGSGLKSFIREGQPAAEVIITLKNQGEEAYKPQIYGKSIVISRRFTKEGSSSYRIMSKDNKLVSTKREELANICDHMNIQVDNPMNVLTQGVLITILCRQFLSASAPADKYKFFLKGTQLQQLSDEYDTILENVTLTTKVIHSKRDAIEDLRQAFKDAKDRFEEASKAREQKVKVDELKKELAWSHVNAKEDEMRRKLEEVAKLERRLPRVQENVDAAEAQIQVANEKVALHEQELQDLGDIDELHAQKTVLTDQMRGNKTKIQEYKSREKELDTSFKEIHARIAQLDHNIDEEKKKLEKNTQAETEQRNLKLADTQAQLIKADKELEDIKAQKIAKNDEMTAARVRGQEAERMRDDARKTIQECEGQAAAAVTEKKNSLAAFGRNIKGVLEQIKAMKWFGNVPVGPFGMFVNVKDPQKWAGVLRVQLGGAMTSFAITDPRDRPALKKLLDQSGNQGAQIIISEYDIFDYSGGEPGPNVMTVLRAIEVADPYVLRILINQQRIERTLLAETRLEADNLLSRFQGGGQAWSADLYNVRQFGDGGGNSQMLTKLGASDFRQNLFTGRNAEAQAMHWQNQIREANERHEQAITTLDQCRRAHQTANAALQALTTQERQTHQRASNLRIEMNRIQSEINDDLPAAIAALQSAREEAEAEKEDVKAKFATVEKTKSDLDAEQNKLLTELKRVRDLVADYEEKKGSIRTKIEDAVTDRMNAQNSKAHYSKKLDEEKKKVDEASAAAALLQEEYESWSEKAERYCARVETKRKAEEVQRNLDSVQAALKEREKKHGATVEEMTIQVNKAQADLHTAESDLADVTALNKSLKSSLVLRLQKWHEFRRHIALRCKVVFQYHLANRGYYGKVLFDHGAGTLQLKVQTDDQAGTQTRDKDPRSLSGGEKSFSTICLLLSLWEAIGCPIRCLDEFDVFMDAVNRRISMKTMIDTANSSDGKQYVLITPQDMTSVAASPTVRIHRMLDPERGQRTLPFGAA